MAWTHKNSFLTLIACVVFSTALLFSIPSAKSQVSWELLPGSAHDIADGWIIGTNGWTGGFGIYRWSGSGWQQMPGGGIRIGGTSGMPWVVNNNRRIYRWNGRDWDPMPGSARDVGDGWVIGTISTGGGYRIYRWSGSSWQQMPGGAVRIGGSYAAPWVVNDQGEVYRWNGSDWDPVPGISARDAGYGWAIGTNQVFGGYEIYRQMNRAWELVPGGAIAISKPHCDGYVYVVNEFNEIYRSNYQLC